MNRMGTRTLSLLLPLFLFLSCFSDQPESVEEVPIDNNIEPVTEQREENEIEVVQAVESDETVKEETIQEETQEISSTELGPNFEPSSSQTPSGWYEKEINISDPFDVTKKNLVSTLFLVPYDEPMGWPLYTLVFYQDDVFFYGSNFWGATIMVRGRYEIIDGNVRLYEINQETRYGQIPESIKDAQEVKLILQEIDRYEASLALVDESGESVFLVAGTAPDVGAIVTIHDNESRLLKIDGELVSDTIGYTEPTLLAPFEVGEQLFFDEKMNRQLESNDDLLFYSGASIKVIASSETDQGMFYFCRLPVMHEFYTSIKLWIPSEAVAISIE